MTVKYLVLFSAPFNKSRAHRTLWYLRRYDELSIGLKYQCTQLGIDVVTKAKLKDDRLKIPRTLNEANALATELGYITIKYQNINWKWRKRDGNSGQPGDPGVPTP